MSQRFISSARAAFAIGGAVLAWSASQTLAAVIPASADAEVRETQPERTRGFGGTFPTDVVTPPTNSGQQAELQISTVAGIPNRNLAIIRFTMPASIVTSADLQGHAAINLYARQAFSVGGGRASLRLYGVNPMNAQALAWNEQTVNYRDTGTHSNPTPVIGINQAEPAGLQAFSQPTVPANPSGGAPPAPFLATPGTGTNPYGGNPAAVNHAPGIRYENAPYSQRVQNENIARATFNNNRLAAFLDAQLLDPGADPAMFPYMPYINQPGYNVNRLASDDGPNGVGLTGDFSLNGNGYWADVPDTNRPFFSGATGTYLDDLEDTTLIGYSFIRAGAVAAGDRFGIGSDSGRADIDSPFAATEAALVAFLGAGLDAGARQFTFIVGGGVGLNGDIISNTNFQFASKDFIPTGGAAGDYAPRLFVAPEPGSLALLGIGAAGLLRRRRSI